MCNYLAAISVASSVQVTLQFYFQIFYSRAPNKTVIKLTKIKNTNCSAKVSWGYKTISKKKHIQRNKSWKYILVEFVHKKDITKSTKEHLSKLQAKSLKNHQRYGIHIYTIPYIYTINHHYIYTINHHYIHIELLYRYWSILQWFS